MDKPIIENFNEFDGIFQEISDKRLTAFEYFFKTGKILVKKDI